MSTRDEDREQAYRAALRAMMIKNGGALAIAPEEMPVGAYSIMWRHTEEGGIEMKLQDGGRPQ